MKYARTRAHLMVSLDIGRVIGNGIGNPKVDQLELSPDKNEIRGFEVRVYNLLFVDNLHCLEHLVVTTKASAPVGKGRENGHDLLPVVCNPDHIKRLLLLVLKES
jgi:hypothetical protein